MLMFCFFITVFASASWLIYAVMFVNSKLAETRLWEQSTEQMLLMLTVVFLPMLIIWLIFGFINQFSSNKAINVKQNELLKQLQKNQDYTDLVVRVMLDAEHEIKDGFVINKFDLFVSDMNEALSEIIQRCNIASSAQLEQLWQRVKRGERWVLGKAILDASKSQSTFDAWVREKVNRDKVFRGTMLEFCSRYQNLLQLLEKHDRDRIFLRIIETGVFGKVYSIIAPLSEGLGGLTASPADKIQPSKSESDYSSVLKIATMEEPKASETIVNVDKNDNEEENDFETMPKPRFSFFSKLNPFRRKEEEFEDEEREQDPFFRALHNSFQDSNDLAAENKNTSFSSFGGSSLSFEGRLQSSEEPMFSSETDRDDSLIAGGDVAVDNEERRAPTFGNAKTALDSLRNSNEMFSTSGAVSDENLRAVKAEPVLGGDADFSVNKNEAAAPEVVKNEEKEENMAYPFGGWTDEDNYR